MKKTRISPSFLRQTTNRHCPLVASPIKMKLNTGLRNIFNLIYIVTIAHGWYIGMLVIKKRGIYMGDLPEKGRDLLDFYASHPLHGIMNMSAASFGMPALTIFCLLGMGKDLQSQSLWMNFLNMSNILSANCFMLNVYEWITRERSY